jgi:anti-sigma factor RsiW
VDNLFSSERFEKGWHPGEDDLLCYLDGELSPGKSAELKTHLEACWACRAKTEKIQRTISSFVEYLNDGFVPNVDPPPKGWRTFDAKMDRAAAETIKQPLLSRWHEWARNLFLHRGLSARWIASLLAIMGVAFAFAHFESVSPLSANQLIRTATEAQERRIQRVPHPVVYQKLRVQRKEGAYREDSSVTWEIWNDTTGDRFRQRVEDSKGQRLIDPRPENVAVEGGADRNPQLGRKDAFEAASGQSDCQAVPSILLDLDQVLRSNRMNHRDPLSPMGYASWRKSIRRQTEEVRETTLPDGEKALALLTAALAPSPVNAIVKAELVIRTEDWHPVAQRIQVQGENGVRDYDLTETEFEILASNALPHSIFEDPPVSTPSVTTSTVTAPKILLPDATDSVASEVETLFALHRVRACIGRPISVVKITSGRIEVKGVVDTDVRKAELLAALKGIPRINTKIQTVEETKFEPPSEREILPGNEKDPAASALEQEGDAKVKSERLVIQDLLEEYFSAAHSKGRSSPGQEETGATSIQQEIAALSHNAVSFSEAALEEAWALRRLAELSSSLKTEELRTSSRRLLELMVRDHLDALRMEINRARTLVTPVLSALLMEKNGSAETNPAAVLESPAADKASWALASLHLFSAVDRTVGLTLGLFADTRFPEGSRDETMRELLWAFNDLEDELQKLEFEVGQAFSERAELLTSKGSLE